MMRESKTDILVVGGGVGGCAAAIAATDAGKRAILTEVTDWIGGQFTAQAVPPDEHRRVEALPLGCTARNRRFREGVRSYYRQYFPLTPRARRDPALNPGGCWVSRLCFEPRIGLAVLEQMMAAARSRTALEVRVRRRPTAVHMDGDRARAVTLLSTETGDEEVIHADYVLDATELGDLLPLAGVEYVTGAESRAETGEPHAPHEAQPDNVQAFTWCFPMGYDPEGEHIIERPAQYRRWAEFVPQLTPPWPGRLLDWTFPEPMTLEPRRAVLFPHEHPDPQHSLWLYRRIICSDIFQAHARPPEVTLVNWPQNDYFGGNIIDKPPEVVEEHLEAARQLSLSLLYWLQTEAPRPDGGVGYPGLHLRPDIVETEDGLAKHPYIRESRRIRAEFTIKEQDISAEDGDILNPVRFPDGVAIGCWHSIDIHPTTGGNNYIDIWTRPPQIPLGALIPIRVDNLLPASTNLGVTHITNACYRVHAIEWSVGEVAGLLATYSLDHGLVPRQVRADPDRLDDFRVFLAAHGIYPEWPALE